MFEDQGFCLASFSILEYCLNYWVLSKCLWREQGMIVKWQLQGVTSMLFRGKNSMVYKSHGDSACALYDLSKTTTKWNNKTSEGRLRAKRTDVFYGHQRSGLRNKVLQHWSGNFHTFDEREGKKGHSANAKSIIIWNSIFLHRHLVRKTCGFSSFSVLERLDAILLIYFSVTSYVIGRFMEKQWSNNSTGVTTPPTE